MGDIANLKSLPVMAVLLLGLVAGPVSADPNLIAHYTFDDGDANDSSGNGHDGTLLQGDANTSIGFVYDAVRDSNVLDCNNPVGHTDNSVVDCSTGSWVDDIQSTITTTGWTKVDTIHTTNYMMTKGGRYQMTFVPDGRLRFYIQGSTPNTQYGTSSILDSQWHHIACTYDATATERKIYIDGELETTENPTGVIGTDTQNLVIGGRISATYTGRGWNGLISDFRLYDNVLSHAEVRKLAENYKAYDPVPTDGATGQMVNLASIGWKSGVKAGGINGTHKVYIDQNKALVEANDVSVYKGQFDSNSYSGSPMGALTVGTYYWRIDTVNGVEEWPGDIWSFTTVSLKASEPNPADISKYVGTARVSWRAGLGAINHAVYYGTDFNDVNDANASVYKGTFTVTTDPNWPISPALVEGQTYYWRVDANGTEFYQGDVWSFTTGTDGYYKDVLMDGGIGLSETKTLPVSDYLGFSWEYVSLPRYDYDATPEDYDVQDKVFTGDVNDNNGRLLYPDGQPRFRCVYVRGGSSFTHGESLGADGRQRFRDFFADGGSYSGTCAGFSIASLCRSDKSPSPYPSYLHIWPAKCYYGGITGGAYLDHIIPTDSPLLDYYDFGGDYYIEDLYHNMGSYAIEDDPVYWCTGSEVLMIHDNPGHHTDGNVSCLAYKEDANSGRLSLIGSHPESATSGEKRDLMAALLQYAMDGQGWLNAKAQLQNDVMRQMNDNSTAGHEKVGDKQYHHFTVQIPSGMKLTITLDGLDDVNDLDLFARKDDFALRGETGLYEASNTSNSDETLTINDPCAGTWYIGVKGVNTVSTTLMSWGQDYTGNLGLLNGVAYTITAEWHMLGDFNGANDVDSVDFSALALSWRKAQGQAGYDPNCDISIPVDNVIDEKDLDVFSDNWLAGK